MASEVALFGIRHHGPGSARRLVDALEALRPAAVLIEGPADVSDLLPMLADPAMVPPGGPAAASARLPMLADPARAPPVALLAYAADDPSRAIFWPFAVYSPEYQAA